MKALVVAESAQLATRLVKAVRAGGLHPVLAFSIEQAMLVVARSRPDVAILPPDAARAGRLMRDLKRRDIPIVLVGDPEQLSATSPYADTLVAAVPDPEDVAEALEIVLGKTGVPLPDSVETGPLRLDLNLRLAFLDGRPVGLPPKELAIVIELARRPGHPVSSTELMGLVWSPGTSATPEDVHRHVYRLRKLLGDHDRDPPLIACRRGFGYVLNDPESLTRLAAPSLVRSSGLASGR